MSIQGKRILVVTSVYPRFLGDSVGVFIQELVLNLRTIGVQCTVFAPAYKGLGNQFLKEIKVHRFRYFFKLFEDLTHGGEGAKAARAPNKVQQNPFYLLIASLYILLGTWQLFWVCVKEKPDLLNVHWPFPHGLMALPASKILGIPMVFSFHGAELNLVKKLKFFLPVMRWLLSMSKQVTTNSSYTKELVKKIYDCPITVIPYGLTIETKAKAREFLADDLPRLLCVANMFERKGIKYLLKALPLVLAKRPVKLRIIGKGQQEQALKSQCKILNLQDNVKFLGFVSSETLDQEYASCDIFVLPSIIDSNGDTEGQGIPIIEAMSYGKPVVASAVGGIIDAINPGETGVLVAEKDPQSLAEAILELLSNPDKAKKMGKKGMEDIQKRYSWETLTQAWQEVLQKAVREDSLGTKSLIQ